MMWAKLKLSAIKVWKRSSEQVVFIITILLLFLTFIFARIPTLLLYYYFWRLVYTLPFLLEHNMLVYITLSISLLLICLLVFSKRRETSSKHGRMQRTPKPVLKSMCSIIVGISIILLLGELFLPIVILQPVDSKIHSAIIDAKSLLQLHNASVEYVVQKVTDFVNREIKNSYRRFESVFEIDNFPLSPLDYYILNLFGFKRAHIIVFQGWGSCGQYAIVTEYMLRNLGFDSRRAKFIDRDHEWAEVYVNETWFIVDPWFIAHSFNGSILTPAQLLATAEEFKTNKGVIVMYPNGTEIDASLEHGYAPKN